MEDAPLPPEGFAPELGIVLGSGLGFFADDCIEMVDTLSFEAIAGFPVSSVPGHAGRFVFGRLAGRPVVCMQGRVHRYEGYELAEVVRPVRLMAGWGVGELLLTNAAGGIHPEFCPGDLMRITDHINFLGSNPLIGVREGERFPDMTEAYDRGLGARLEAAAARTGVALRAGVYLAVTGPSFETPAEIRAFRTLGADAVGMSTVPEVIAARSLGLKVAGLSCISNAAAGLGESPLSHGEVSRTVETVKERFAALVTAFAGGSA